MQKSFPKVCNTRDIKRYLHVSKNEKKKKCLRGVTQISYVDIKLCVCFFFFNRNSGSSSFVIVKNAKINNVIIH